MCSDMTQRGRVEGGNPSYCFPNLVSTPFPQMEAVPRNKAYSIVFVKNQINKTMSLSNDFDFHLIVCHNS